MESVVLLSQRKAEDSPEAETGQDGLAKATYEEIQKYVAEHGDRIYATNL